MEDRRPGARLRHPGAPLPSGQLGAQGSRPAAVRSGHLARPAGLTPPRPGVAPRHDSRLGADCRIREAHCARAIPCMAGPSASPGRNCGNGLGAEAVDSRTHAANTTAGHSSQRLGRLACRAGRTHDDVMVAALGSIYGQRHDPTRPDHHGALCFALAELADWVRLGA